MLTPNMVEKIRNLQEEVKTNRYSYEEWMPMLKQRVSPEEYQEIESIIAIGEADLRNDDAVKACTDRNEWMLTEFEHEGEQSPSWLARIKATGVMKPNDIRHLNKISFYANHTKAFMS